MKTFCKFILFTVACFFVLHTELHAGDQLKDGKAALERGDVLAAIPLLQEATRKDKKNAQTFYWLGIAYIKADSLNSAEAALVAARELDAKNATIYVALGDVYAKQNIHAAAAQQYQSATELDSTKPDVFIKLARSLMKTKKYNVSAVAYYRAIQLDTSNIDAYRELGKLYMLAKQYSKAVPLLQRLVGLVPNETDQQIQLVKAFYYTQKYTELIPFGQKIWQKDSTQIEVLRMLATAYVKTKDNENGEKLFSVLEKHDTLKADDYVKLGQAQKGLDKVDQAIASYEKAFRVDSTLGEIYYDLGALYMKRKRYSEAVSLFEKKIAMDTSSNYQFAAHLNAGITLMQMKEFERARQHIIASVNHRPDYIPAWSSLGACYAQMDSLESEREAYSKVIELIANNSNGDKEKYKDQLEEANRGIGFAWFIEKKYPQALEFLKKSEQINPKNCPTLLGIAQVSTILKNFDDGKKYVCKVLQLCPNNEDAKKLAASLSADCK